MHAHHHTQIIHLKNVYTYSREMKLGERNPGLLARTLETMNGEFNGEVYVSPKQNFLGETKTKYHF